MQAPDLPQLLVFSGATPDSLKQLIQNYKEFLERNPESIGDLAYTLSNRREHLSYRAFAVATKHDTLNVSPITRSGQVPNVVMVFTGQGAQWPQMGRELLQDPNYTIFQQSIQSLDKYLQASTFRPEWSIEEELLKGPKTSRLNTAEFSQPLCTAIQISLVKTLTSIGVVPAAVVGHSSGELAAAYASGAITAKEAIVGAFHRGAATKLQTKAGAMAVIGLGWDEAEKFLTSGVIIACENSPKSVTLSGDVDKVNAVVASIQEAQPDILARVLKVDKAYHSHHMVEIGNAYHKLIADEIFGKEPTKPFFSSVTGQIQSQGTTPLSARYWQKNLESPVLFSTAVTALLKHEIANNAVFLEIGPHSGLAGPLRQIQTQNSNSAPYISTMLRNQDCVESFLSAIGKLYSVNVAVDLKKLIPSGTTLPDLPRYPWNHSETYWYESRLSKEWRHREHPYHDLLGVRIPESIGFEPVWRNMFHLENAPWIRDHKVKDDVVFPFAGYAGMVGEAVRQISGIQEAFTLRQVVVSTALVLSEAKPTEIMTSFRRHRLTDFLDSEWWEFTIFSHNGHMWLKHCMGQVRAQAESLGPGEVRALPPRKVASKRCYNSMERSGLNFGPTFRRLEEIRSETTRQVATAMAVNKEEDQVGYHLHPTLIDASMQLLTVAATKGYAGQVHSKTLLPTNIEELRVHRCSSNLEITTSATFTLGGGIMGETKCTAAGHVVLEISGLRLTAIDEGGEDEDIDTTARPEWGPHIDFVDPKSLIKQSVDLSLTTPLLDDLTQLCMISSQRRLQGLKSDIPHMQKYASWMSRHLKTAAQPEFTNLDDAALENLVRSLVERLSETPAADAAMAIYNTFIHIRGIFTGTKDGLEILLDDDRLVRIDEFMNQCDRSPLLKRISHSKPSLRVLEIGAGTGAATKSILKDLAPSDGQILYSQYVYTDISTGIFVAAKENFKDYPNIEYATLDISKGLAGQGFEGREFDLVIASNVIHATKSLQDSLQNVRKLLAPNGRFFLTELNSTSTWVNYIW
jgi:acyl transferase domain-containing protein/2-polyprenyl-3-methyl-5-hydroxy-6-metoxy-1,4-benzoquinol methylase